MKLGKSKEDKQEGPTAGWGVVVVVVVVVV